MTFVAALTVMAALARAIAGGPDGTLENASGAERTADAIARLVADTELPDRLVAWLGEPRSTVILGRGSARAASEMGALTVKEAVGMPIEALQTAQFRHGPLELAGPGLAAIVIATEPATAELDRSLAEELARLGSAVWFVTAGGSGPRRHPDDRRRRARPAPRAGLRDRPRPAPRLEALDPRRPSTGQLRPRDEGDDA
jgi:glucosamine--fructose-6-phosphate aminotransferase (isomerizing)